MKNDLEVTISAVVRRTIFIRAWDISEAEEDAIEVFEAGISGEYDLSHIEIEEVVSGGIEDMD